MRKVDLPVPLNMLQAIEAHDKEGLKRLYALLAEQLGASTPSGDFDGMVEEIASFEHHYGIVRAVKTDVQAVIKAVSDLEKVFRPIPVARQANGPMLDFKLDKLRPHLDSLQAKGMMSYSTGNFRVAFGQNSGGSTYDLTIQVHDEYYKIAEQVMS